MQDLHVVLSGRHHISKISGKISSWHISEIKNSAYLRKKCAHVICPKVRGKEEEEDEEEEEELEEEEEEELEKKGSEEAHNQMPTIL